LIGASDDLLLERTQWRRGDLGDVNGFSLASSSSAAFTSAVAADESGDEGQGEKTWLTGSIKIWTRGRSHSVRRYAARHLHVATGDGSRGLVSLLPRPPPTFILAVKEGGRAREDE